MTRVAGHRLRAAAGALLLAFCALLVGVPGSSAAFTAKVVNATNTTATNPFFTCTAAAVAGSAYYVYPLDDNPPSNGAAARDVSGNNRPGTYRNSAAHSTANACVRDGGGSTTFDGVNDYVSTPNLFTAPQTFSTEVWFRTTTAGGVLIGYQNSLLGLIPTAYDRVVYLIAGGRLTFAVRNGGIQAITTPAGTSYADGNWHHMVATLSSAGMRLYVDGVQVASGTNAAADNNNGYWRIAYTYLNGYPNAPANAYFSGQLGYAAVYTTALSATVVAQHEAAGTT